MTTAAESDPWVIKPYTEPTSPAEVELWLRYASGESSKADADVKRANDAVVFFTQELADRVNAVTLDEETPVISRTFTVAHLKAHVDSATREERRYLALAEAQLSAAKSRLHILGRISRNLQTLNANIRSERGETWQTSSPRKSPGR